MPKRTTTLRQRILCIMLPNTKILASKANKRGAHMNDETFETILQQQRITDEEKTRRILIEELNNRDKLITNLINELRKINLDNTMLLERTPSMPPLENYEKLYKHYSLMRQNIFENNEKIKEILQQLQNPKRTEL